MKKIFNKILAAASFVALAAGCSVQEIEFSHETASFDVKENLILIEAIAPLGLTSSDAVYIAGPAIGDSAAVVSSTKYQMEMAPDMNQKWGVYLDPADFRDGKTLADGFYFVVIDRGHERTPLNQEPEHTLQASVGHAYTVYMAGAWSNDFLVREPVDIPVHTNFRIYIEDKTGWDEIRLYMYNYDGKGQDNLYGGWPGLAPAGTIELDGKDWTYFEVGPAANGLSENVIFNNNNNGVQTHDDPHITFDVADFFFTVTADVATLLPNLGIDRKPELEEEEPEPDDGPKLYIRDRTTWAKETGSASIFAHYWGISSTEWPGKELTDFVTIDGEEYLVLSTPRGNRGTNVGLILHPNVGDETTRVTVDQLMLDTDRYYELTNDGLTELNRGTRIWVKNESGWPGKLNAHLWYDEAGTTISTEWPGIEAIPGYAKNSEYDVILVPETFSGKNVGIIFHDGTFRLETNLTISDDIFYILRAEYVLEEEDPYVPARIYIEDQTGWPGNFFAHFWNDSGYSTAWPGIAATTETVNGVEYKVIVTDDAVQGETLNVIFHSDENDGENRYQTTVTIDKDRFYVLTKEGLTEKGPARIYVEDQTGWPGNFFAHFWNDNGYSTAWPGIAATTETVDGVEYKVILTDEAVQGETLHVIFHSDENDGENRVETMVTLDKDRFYTLTTAGLEEKGDDSVKIFLKDETGWPGNLFAHFWNDSGYSTAWPGLAAKTETIDGVEYKVVVTDKAVRGQTLNVIFHSDQNDGENRYQTTVTVDKDRYYTLKVNELVEF